MSGKWMIYVPTSEVDGAWSLMANAVWEGKLGDTAKVNPSRSDCTEPTEVGKKRKSSSSQTHVICVYSSNFEDEDVIFDMRAQLRDLGFGQKLRYKPDAYTYCDIYYKNRWRIPPTVYCA